MSAPEPCKTCRGTGWVTVPDYDDGSSYDTACTDPNCTAPLEPDETDTEASMIPDRTPEVPY